MMSVSSLVLLALCLTGAAATNATCGATCVVNTDCGLDIQLQCGLCMKGQCQSGCGMRCAVSSQCGDEQCSSCNNGYCGAPTAPPTPAPTGSQCGGVCVVNTQCPGSCGLCFKKQNATIGYCGALCGGHCTESSHCGLSCPLCSGGKCVPSSGPVPTPVPQTKCGNQCTVDSECPASCRLCAKKPGQHFGRCGADCGGHCLADLDCSLSCSVCNTSSSTCVAKQGKKML
eukprot:Rhum_TRINITY_DN12352_c0_g2::Rhum_TRINITY_DN12352_c0_g2_i1::g.51243::m.51243